MRPKKNNTRNKFMFLFTIIILFILVCLKIDNKFNNSLIVEIINCPSNIINTVKSINKVKSENKIYKQKQIKLNVLYNQIEILKKENDNLRKDLDLKQNEYKQIQFAEVIKRREIYWSNYLIINKGSKDNIKKGEAVVNEDGLVGIIDITSKNYSKVKLVTSIDNLSAVISKDKDYYGIIKNYKDNKLIMEGISNYDLVEVGDKVYSSNIGMIGQKILIGEIEAIEKDNYNISKIIYIKPSVNFNDISILGVLTHD